MPSRIEADAGFVIQYHLELTAIAASGFLKNKMYYRENKDNLWDLL